MDANQLREAFTGYFVKHGHTLVPSSGLIPHHPMAPLFTNAGMNQFLPYFLGEEAPPYPRATSVQKCVRIRGKHDDIELIGRTTRHLSCFEMLGNFSFGDYFKEGAIKFHWELFTEVLGLDGDRLWITVHLNDDTAADIWRDTIGIPPERIQRMDEDNFWEMGETGPCGPCSELYYDRGKEYGDDGGPLYGDDERFREIGNLVFMEFDRKSDRSLVPLPKQNIDTGSGLERILPTLQNVNSVWDIDSIRPIVGAAESITGQTYGDNEEVDVSLRIMADHARAMTFLVSDGVFPSNEDRGYVLRRIVRRMLRHANKIGGDKNVTGGLVSSVVKTMGRAYPDVVRNEDFVVEVLGREEHRFHQTIKSGSAMLDQELESGDCVSGEAAFKLHDTYGFPIELTNEIAAERGKSVDVVGFEAAMERQRKQARENIKVEAKVSVDAYRKVVDEYGPTDFVGYEQSSTDTKIVEVMKVEGSDEVEIFLESSPFYAEQGGQVGDTGHITTETGTAQVTNTTWALPGLARHTARVVDGRIEAGQDANAAIDVERRNAIRRNHTGTHILHWALRQVLGDHVKQSGSMVAPDRLRFDFSHYNALSAQELAKIESLANNEVLTDAPVETRVISKQEALDAGAIAFFGDKYGETVRVLQAGNHSLELCGGTHVHALGYIGPIKIVSEGSIGSNLRRIEAVTGTGAFEYIRDEEQMLETAALALKTRKSELAEAIQRSVARQKTADDEIKSLRAQLRKQASEQLRSCAKDGVIVERVDDVAPNELRELALSLRSTPDIKAAVLIGTPDGKSVSLVSATDTASGLIAADLIAASAKLVGGGGGKGSDLAMAGGRDINKIDEAVQAARDAAN